MKKLLILAICLILVGCSTENGDKKPETTPTATPVITETSDTGDKNEENTEEDKNDGEDQQKEDGQGGNNETTGNAGEDTDVISNPEFNETSLSASFVENVDGDKTTITFNDDNTFETKLNICSTFENMNGEYTKDGSDIVMWFNEPENYVGYKFKFTLENDTLTIKPDSEFFSCSGVDAYTINK